LIDCFIDYETTHAELTIRLELEFAGKLDATRLEKAVDLALHAEPVLGCRFVIGSSKPYFERLEANKCSAFLLANSASEYDAFKYALIDHGTGPQIKVCLWHSIDGDRLLLKVAHHVADAAGVKDVAAILSDIYRHLSEDPAYRPAPNAKEWRSYRQVVRHVPWHAYPRIFMNFVGRAGLLLEPRTVHTLSVTDGPREPLTYVVRLIPSSRVSTLVEYGRSHDATLNDVFLTASLRGLLKTADWDKRSYLSLTATMDMRRYIPSGQAGAVANLSIALNHWPDLGTQPGDDFKTTLEKVARITRYGKTHWIGLEQTFFPVTVLLKVMPHTWGMKRYTEFTRMGLRRQACEHALTNTGPIEPESVTFGIRPSAAHILPPQNYPPMPFMWSLSGYDGTLTLAAGAFPTQKESIEKFFDAVLKELPA
jgi:NRPS condensation-like uncharacterized protein